MYAQWRAMSGQMPRVEPHLLPDMLAQKARNTVIARGGVESLKDSTFTADSYKGGEKLTIYRDGQHIDDDTKYWLTFTADVDITRGPVVDDELGRLFYTGDGVPKMTNSLIGWADPGAMPVNFYNLGIPAPNAAPTLGVSGTADAEAEPVSVLAAYAFVTSDGFVGPLSPAAGPFTYQPGMTFEAADMQSVVSGAYDITKKYVYVAQTDSEGATAFRFWKELPIGTGNTGGVLDFNTLAEEADSPSLIAPPDDLFGLMLHPNGFLVGFTTRKYCRSELWKPHGWPSEYQDPFGPDIVGGGIVGSQVIICTRGTTYAAIGTDPLNQQIIDYSGTQPCVSKRSIRAMPFGVLYASPDGLVAAGSPGSQLQVVSDPLYTRKQWQALNPASMHACIQDGRYHLFWKVSDTEKGSLIFDFATNGAVKTLVESDQWYSAAYTDARRDELYVAGADGDIYKWDSGEPLTALWRSAEMRFGRHENVGAVRIHAEDYPVRFRLYDVRIDGKKRITRLVSEVDVKSAMPERLNGQDRYGAVYWEIEGTHKWTEVEIGSSIHSILNKRG